MIKIRKYKHIDSVLLHFYQLFNLLDCILMPACIMKSLGEDFPEIWMRDDQKSNLLVKTKKLIQFGIVFLDSRLVPTELNGVFSRLPPIPRRDFGANDIDVIVKMVLKQSRRSHHNRLVLPSIKINNYRNIMNKNKSCRY